MDAVESVAGEEEGTESGGEREVGEGGYIVVGEVDGVLVLQLRLFSGGDFSVHFRTHGRLVGEEGIMGNSVRGRRGEGVKDKPLQRPDSQSRVSYVLWSSFMISMELASKKCSICSFQLV